MSEKDKPIENEGEGSYTAAREFDKDQHLFAKSGKVEEKAKEARDALDGPEGEALEKARKDTKDGVPD